jgi:hypothetical protein
MKTSNINLLVVCWHRDTHCQHALFPIPHLPHGKQRESLLFTDLITAVFSAAESKEVLLHILLAMCA